MIERGEHRVRGDLVSTTTSGVTRWEDKGCDVVRTRGTRLPGIPPARAPRRVPTVTGRLRRRADGVPVVTYRRTFRLSPDEGCWYAFGLSILDGYHSVLLLVDHTGTDPVIYWLDQFATGIDDDVTTTLDERVTTKTQNWWQAVMDSKGVGYKTTARLWQLRKPVGP